MSTQPRHVTTADTAQSGRTFRMARDGSHIPAPPSPLLTQARRQHNTSRRSPLR
jgi:hypothetical protein